MTPRDTVKSTEPVAGVRFASDLGWPPGHWPSSTTVDDVLYIRHDVMRGRENEVTGVNYRNAQGKVLVVYND